jgi:hypothetical protein
MTIDRFRILLAEINEYQIDEEDNYYFLSELFNDFKQERYSGCKQQWEEIGTLKTVWNSYPSIEFSNTDDIGYLEYRTSVVLYLEKYNKYIKLTAWVSSYEDYEISEIKEVFPVEKTIIIYE